jgi:hypothetical protein
MYASKYFEGTSKDPETNIRSYGAGVATKLKAIESALNVALWEPSHASPPREDPSTTRVLTDLVEEHAAHAANVLEQNAAHVANVVESHAHSIVPLVALGVFCGGLALVLATRAQAVRVTKRVEAA